MATASNPKRSSNEYHCSVYVVEFLTVLYLLHFQYRKECYFFIHLNELYHDQHIIKSVYFDIDWVVSVLANLLLLLLLL